VERMDAIAMGGIRDDAFLRTVVRGVLDKDGVVLDAKLGADALARRLGEATSSGVPVTVAGASWSWPKTLDGLQAGDEVMVYAKLDAAPLKIDVGTQSFSPDLRTSDRPLVERAWAQAKIQSLIDAPTEDAAATKRQIISLSTQHRVLSPHTAMLVLETDADYARFGIDRNATVDILTVRDGRIALDREPRAWEEKQARLEAQKNKGNVDGEGWFGRRKAAQAPTTATESAVAATPMATTAPLASAAAPGLAPPSGGPRAGGALADADEDGVGRNQNRADAPAEEPRAERSAAVDDLSRDRRAADVSGLVGGSAGEVAGAAGLGRAAGGAVRAPVPLTIPAPPPAQAAPAASGAFRAPTRGPSPTPRPNMDPADPFAAHTTTAATGQVRQGALVVDGGISQGEVQRVLRGQTAKMRECYTRQLQTQPSLRGSMELRVVVGPLGEVKSVVATRALSEPLDRCVTQAFKTVTFPAPGTGDARFTASFDFVSSGGGAIADNDQNRNVPKALPYEGRFKIVMERLANADKDGALDEAKRWQADQPGDVMAFVALGEAYEARGDVKTAARAYGSILELFSFRADSRRFAGERLERLSDPVAIRLAADTYGKAAEQRPDHPASHRLYAFTLLKAGEHEKAFEAMKRGAMRSYPSGRFAGVDRILKEDLGLIASAWAAAAPARHAEIMTKLREAGGTPESGPSLRFVLNWETDANDVDFHIHDGRGGHAYYGARTLPSGGELYADVTTGYGPECFTIRGPREKRAYPYTLQAHYYSRGPMGYGMGKLSIVDHDGKGNITFEERPFVVMVDRAYVDLGTVERPRGNETASLK
ncbi:MAG: AgmX/PglI C-terminal domain-containing protein, partial [Labilithrix sp.]|nr:AgmX/PglI C-terminal domain-containing protein [Labilithrix sp.]